MPRLIAHALLLIGLVALGGCAWDDPGGAAPQSFQVAMIRPPAPPSAPGSADFVEGFKSRRLMMLEQDGRVIRTYRIMLGLNPVGPKQREGDKRSPEGVYVRAVCETWKELMRGNIRLHRK